MTMIKSPPPWQTYDKHKAVDFFKYEFYIYFITLDYSHSIVEGGFDEMS